jgi:cytochrome c biogenesis factor
MSLSVLAVCTTFAGLALDAWRHSTTRHLFGVFLMLRQRRRLYCGYAIHLALACLAIGITGSSLGTRRHDADLNEGDVVEWSGRRIEYSRLAQREDEDKLIAEAELRVSRGGDMPVILKPARHLYLLQNQWTTEVAIHSTWTADFYVILHAGLGEGRVALTFIENPLMHWIWLGGWLAAGSGLVAIWPARIKRRRQGGQLRNARQSIALAPVRRRAA